MHSEQVCAGNRDWSSRYAACLPPEVLENLDLCVLLGSAEDARNVRKSEGLSQFAVPTDETEQLWKKCLTSIKIRTLSVNVPHHSLYVTELFVSFRKQ